MNDINSIVYNLQHPNVILIWFISWISCINELYYVVPKFLITVISNGDILISIMYLFELTNSTNWSRYVKYQSLQYDIVSLT